MSDDFPWAHIGGNIPVEVLAELVECGEHWGTVGGITSADYLWKPNPTMYLRVKVNRLAHLLNQECEQEWNHTKEQA